MTRVRVSTGSPAPCKFIIKLIVFVVIITCIIKLYMYVRTYVQCDGYEVICARFVYKIQLCSISRTLSWSTASATDSQLTCGISFQPLSSLPFHLRFKLHEILLRAVLGICIHGNNELGGNNSNACQTVASIISNAYGKNRWAVLHWRLSGREQTLWQPAPWWRNLEKKFCTFRGIQMIVLAVAIILRLLSHYR